MFTPSPASRSFGLKSNYLSLLHCLTRESAGIQVELLKMVRESIEPIMLGAITDVLRDIGFVKTEVI